MNNDIAERVAELQESATKATYFRNGLFMLSSLEFLALSFADGMPTEKAAGIIIGVGSFALGIAANLKSVDCTARANGLVDGERQRIADTMMNVAIGLTKQ